MLEDGFDRSLTETDAKVLLLDSRILDPTDSAGSIAASGCVQLDLRNNDLARMIHYSTRLGVGRDKFGKVLLKGYNIDYSSFEDLEAAYFVEAKLPVDKVRAKVIPSSCPRIIMVLYNKPLVTNVLKESGMNPDTATLEDKLSVSFEVMCKSFEDQINPYIRGLDGKFIPEIVHSGLGLGYSTHTGDAVNPLDGTPILDPSVIFDSRVDRAMIEVSLKIKKAHPELYFSSCTRLCDVRLTTGEGMVADMDTGRLKPKPWGEEGLGTTLRSLHGGLYPKSDLVVADDPFAEIAARTWIDEYAKLDRSQLLEMPYQKWLAQGQAGEQVVDAVNKLNGPYLPNTWETNEATRSDWIVQMSSASFQW